MTKLVLPFAIVDETNLGVVDACGAVVGSQPALEPGIYKIAAMGEPLLWKIGATDVTVSTGSYLAAGDQEVIKVPGIPGTDTVKLSYIQSADGSGTDGEINIVLIHLFEVPSTYPELTTIPE